MVRHIPQIHSTRTASTRALLMPASLPTAIAAPAPAEIARFPQARLPAIDPVPFAW